MDEQSPETPIAPSKCWRIVSASGRSLGRSQDVPGYRESKAACLAFKAAVVDLARQAARERTGAASSLRAETWAGARCVPARSSARPSTA